MEVSSDPLPHGLELVVDYVNTREIRAGTDELGSPEALRRWLADHGLLDARARVTHRELRTATHLRESLRAILLAHHDHAAAPAGAIAELDRVAGRGRLSVRFRATDVAVTLAPARTGLDGALAALLTPVALATLDQTWSRIKACAADDCRWAFYDRSRNRSGRWCEMADCGNRSKVRSYRQRRTGAR